MSQAFLAIPLVLVSAYTSNNTNGTLLVPSTNTAPWAVHGLKCGYHHLINAVDLIVNGVTVNQSVPNLNTYTHFKLVSQMSQDDLKTYESTIGMGTMLDNVQS